MGRSPPFADEVDIAQVYEQTQTLPEHKDQILLMDGIDEENQTAAQAKIPENLGNDTLFNALAGDPLHDETHHEQTLSKQADNRP
jgi:hypothetical protein